MILTLDNSSQDEVSDPDDGESEKTTEHQIQASPLTIVNGLFPKHVTQVLESFYARGMKGWGKQHRPDIVSASEATGLEQSQIEVRVAACKIGIQPH